MHKTSLQSSAVHLFVSSLCDWWDVGQVLIPDEFVSEGCLAIVAKVLNASVRAYLLELIFVGIVSSSNYQAAKSSSK